MKKYLVPAFLAAHVLALGVMMPLAQSQEGKKNIYMLSYEFPPGEESLLETPAAPTTRFWQLMDKETQTTQDLRLTRNLEEADYRVELRCTGLVHCSKLLVDIKDLDRNVLASFTLKGYKTRGLWGRPNLEKVAHELTRRLDERFDLLGQGGYGHQE